MRLTGLPSFGVRGFSSSRQSPFLFWRAERLYLLYLDESGNPDDPTDRHFVLAGAAVHERQTYWLSRDMEEIQARYFPGVQPITFHASEIRSGRGFWRRVQPAVMPRANGGEGEASEPAGG